MVDGPSGSFYYALVAVHKATGVLSELIEGFGHICLEFSIVAAENAHSLHHILGRLDYFGDVFHLLFLNPGRTYQAEERNQGLLRRYQDILSEGLREYVGGFLLCELVGSVIRNEHYHIIQSLATGHVFLVFLAAEFAYMAAHRLEILCSRGFPTLFVFR